VFEKSGTSFVSQDLGAVAVEDHLRDVEQLSDGDVLRIGGENGAVLFRDAGVWTRVRSRTTQRLVALSFLSPSQGFAIGRRSLVLTYTGCDADEASSIRSLEAFGDVAADRRAGECVGLSSPWTLGGMSPLAIPSHQHPPRATTTMLRTLPTLPTLLAAVSALAGGAAAQLFADVTAARGLSFEHSGGVDTLGMTGGMAWFDMDADGDDDLLATSGNGEHGLFRNDGGVFTDVSRGSGIPQPVTVGNFGCCVGDYDDDGLPDVFLLNNGPNVLLHNEGDGNFRDATEAVGLVGPSQMSSAGSWADFDRDGDLDLYVGNYIDALDFPYHLGSVNRLWINEGSPQRPAFVDRAPELGVDDVGVYPPPVPGFEPGKQGQRTPGCTLSVNTQDYDDDGDADILVGNDFGEFVLPNALFRNETPRGGPLAFTDASTETGLDANPHYNMGINGADYDGDGDWDFYTSNLGDNELLRNDGGTFVDVVQEAGPVEGKAGDGLLLTSWATIWLDVDNDGWEDLYVVNGWVPAADFILNEERSPNSLWHNRGDGTFRRIDFEGRVSDRGVGRGAGAADVDRDGRLEIYLVDNGLLGQHGDANRLFENQSADVGHWAELRLRGTLSNAEALGARVDVRAGERLLRRQVHDTSVYLTSPSRVVHVGLGDATRMDVVTIRWPSGVVQELLDLPADAYLEVVEPPVTIREGPRAGGGRVTATLVNADARPRPWRLEATDDGGAVLAWTSGTLGGGASAEVALEAPGAARLVVSDPGLGARDMRAVPRESHPRAFWNAPGSRPVH